MLSGPLLDQAADALTDAFPLPGELDRLVAAADIGVTFANYRMAGAGDVRHAVFNLLTDANAKGLAVRLLHEAHSRAPLNTNVSRLWSGFAGYDAELRRYGADLGQYETVLFRARPFAEVGAWLGRLAALSRAVCRIEPQPSMEGVNGYGTGFLVAPGVVLTNAHVAGPFWTDPAKAAHVVCRFDAEAGAGEDGTPHPLARDYRLLIGTAEGLDFALLKLGKPAGEDRVDGGQRGYLVPTAYDLTPPEPLVILQHPAAAPLKLALGVASRRTPPPLRVAYEVSTDGGSSGSPVLTQNLDVVALHCQGGGGVNFGVPFAALLQHFREPGPRTAMADAGLSHLLC